MLLSLSFSIRFALFQSHYISLLCVSITRVYDLITKSSHKFSVQLRNKGVSMSYKYIKSTVLMDITHQTHVTIILRLYSEKGWGEKTSVCKMCIEWNSVRNETGLNSSTRLDGTHNIFIVEQKKILCSFTTNKMKSVQRYWMRFSIFLHNILIRLPFEVFFFLWFFG